ncbi:MAG TPA: CocE/NonD family hydrolase, partial [Actinomycetota bacterium]|nr:CocE/NonD family hydrolase [Actinomycetota bacterium]
NYGFPLYWTGAIRPLYDVGGGTMAGLLRPLNNPTDTERQKCAGNVATHSRTVGNDPIVQGAVGDTDNDWWRARSLISDIDNVSVPIHITGAYQDEQTGARGPSHLWEKVAGVPKRLVLTNGDHGTNTNTAETRNDRVAWMDHWMRSIDGGFGTLAADEKSVKVLLEMKNSPRASNGSISAADFPIPGTTWTDYNLSTGGSLTTGSPVTGTATYVSGSARQSYQRLQGDPNSGEEFAQEAGPDELRFATAPLSTDTVVAGPITATLNMSATAPDTEIYVEIDDIGPGGVSHLQRGLLKASHRATTDSLSDHIVGGPHSGDIYRPWRPHTNPQNILPGTTYKYLVEIWPVGHVFRAGHRIGIKIAAPPLVDGIYAYIPKRAVSLNTIYFGGADPSRIMLPIVPVPTNLSSTAPACGALDSVRCTTEGW